MRAAGRGLISAVAALLLLPPALIAPSALKLATRHEHDRRRGCRAAGAGGVAGRQRPVADDAVGGDVDALAIDDEDAAGRIGGTGAVRLDAVLDNRRRLRTGRARCRRRRAASLPPASAWSNGLCRQPRMRLSRISSPTTGLPSRTRAHSSPDSVPSLPATAGGQSRHADARHAHRGDPVADDGDLIEEGERARLRHALGRLHPDGELVTAVEHAWSARPGRGRARSRSRPRHICRPADRQAERSAARRPSWVKALAVLLARQRDLGGRHAACRSASRTDAEDPDVGDRDGDDRRGRAAPAVA